MKKMAGKILGSIGSNVLGIFFVFVLNPSLSQQVAHGKAGDYQDLKKNVATVAVFGLAGAGVGVLTVAASSDTQSRIGNIQAGLVLGAIVGTVYVLSTDGSGDRTMLAFVPSLIPETSAAAAEVGGGVLISHRF